MGEEQGGKTASEQLFETYLKDRAIEDFEREPEIKGTAKRPDYRVQLRGSQIFFEVKEFKPSAGIPTGFWFNPYTRIRSKINEAQKQLHPLKGHMCAIVMANPDNAFVLLEPISICGAMLGDASLTMPFDPKRESFDDSRAVQTFLSGGKMIRYKQGKAIKPQNTTISAICVLGTVDEGYRRLKIRIAQWERETGAKCTLEIVLDMWREAQGTEADASIHRLRMQVYENPYAIAPLTEAFGTGPYDERFGVRNGRLLRDFVGSSLEALEADERASGERKYPLGLRTG